MKMMNPKNKKTMEKKAYIQPMAFISDFRVPIMEGPVISKQFDDGEHTPIGEDDGSDDFTTKDRGDEADPWSNGLW